MPQLSEATINNILKAICGAFLLGLWFAADYMNVHDPLLVASISSLVGYLAGAHTATAKESSK